MRVSEAGLDGLLLIEPDTFADERGFFLESFQAERYRAAGIADIFVQDNFSRSTVGVLRGLHYQVRHPQAQIVTVLRGAIFDVIVDLRRGSAMFGRSCAVELSDMGPRQLYMPPGVAHGFCVLSDIVDLHYKVSRLYDPSDEAGLSWNDPALGIDWPLSSPRISDRDAAFPHLNELTIDQLPHVAGG
jgi:dTDP-4-dehydrorhamnose 3,5-epimerase